MKPDPAPSLDALAADPGLAATVSPEARQALVLRLAAVLAALAASTGLRPAPSSPALRDDEGAQWLAVDEVKRRFGLDRRWLADHAIRLRQLKIVTAPSRKVRLYHVGRLGRFLEARCE